jgi:endoglucanase
MKKKKLFALLLLALTATWQTASAQPKFSMPHGLYDVESLTVTIQPTDASAEIRYTTDGSEPTAESPLYTVPLELSKTTSCVL